MPTFALIAEGMTDLAVIERIVAGIFGDDAIVNSIMPLRDATEKARAKEDTFSSWELVLEHAASEQPLIALKTNDYLIFQIDTDQATHANFGIDLHENGIFRPIAEIVDDCKNLILSKLSKTIPQEWHDRIIFAIPILSTECWLIPIFDKDHKHTTKTVNKCDVRLASVKKGNLTKDYKTYTDACKAFSKKKTLEALANRTPCLRIFIDRLINI